MSIISTMIQISVLFLPLFVVFASFTELIVFNEEVLLLFCFVSFLLYIYNAIGGLVFQSFVDQAQALEQQFSDTLVLSFQARSLQLDKLAAVRRVASCAVDPTCSPIKRRFDALSEGGWPRRYCTH